MTNTTTIKPSSSKQGPGEDRIIILADALPCLLASTASNHHITTRFWPLLSSCSGNSSRRSSKSSSSVVVADVGSINYGRAQVGET